jgi:hypothetical protein
MGAGVIIDDGGSTRIKWMMLDSDSEITGKMRDIMTVRGVEGKGKSTQVITDDRYTQIRIVWMDKYGNPNMNDAKFLDKSILRISSHLGQNVEVINTGAGLNISLNGDLVEPVVEARQQSMQRRYIVTNSGHIKKVTVFDDKGEENVVYDRASLPREVQIVYTSVFLI